jgi:protein SCO1/2
MTKNTTNKKVFFFSIFLIPSLLCLGFYYFAIRKPLTEGRTNIFVKLPHYGPATLAANSKDSSFYQIPNFSFQNQLGNVVSSISLKNKIFIIGVSDYNGQNADQIAAQLYRVQDKLSYLKKDFQIITVLNQIGTDTVTSLSLYGEKVHADARIWNMVAGKDQALLAVFDHNQLFSTVPTSFVKSNEILLIDRNRQIRGHYKGSNLKEVNRMIDEVVVLAAEYGKIKNM